MDTSVEVPIIIISGPVGVGKTSVAWAVSLHLRSKDSYPHAVIDDHLGQMHPKPATDSSGETLDGKALAALWQVYREAGVGRLILPRVVAGPADLEAIDAAIPNAQITVFRLAASRESVEERIRSRQPESAQQWCLERAAELEALWMRQPFGDFVIQTDGRSVEEVAESILNLSGWR
jgi:hypothetical protein